MLQPLFSRFELLFATRLRVMPAMTKYYHPELESKPTTKYFHPKLRSGSTTHHCHPELDSGSLTLHCHAQQYCAFTSMTMTYTINHTK